MTPVDVAPVLGSHARLRATLAELGDVDPHRPSRLPGWNVGHVLTHLARNADSHVRLLDAAARGEVADQYAGGNEQRAVDIEAGSARSAAALVADVLGSAARLEEAWAVTPDHVWHTGFGRVVSGLWALAELPFRRWREVEMHHVDLGLAYGIGDWPDDYVEIELARAIAGLRTRLRDGAAVDIGSADTAERWVVPDDGTPALRVTAERRVVLAWLVGRGGAKGFPALAPWDG